MLRTRVIPCLLLKGEGLVKTVRFRKPVYVGDPINAIRIFNDKGVDELIQTNDLSDETWAELSKFYDKRQMMDFVHVVGHYVMIAWAISAMRMPLEAHADKIGWDLKTASGKVPTATLKPGESDDWAEKRGYEN